MPIVPTSIGLGAGVALVSAKHLFQLSKWVAQLIFARQLAKRVNDCIFGDLLSGVTAMVNNATSSRVFLLGAVGGVVGMLINLIVLRLLDFNGGLLAFELVSSWLFWFAMCAGVVATAEFGGSLWRRLINWVSGR